MITSVSRLVRCLVVIGFGHLVAGIQLTAQITVDANGKVGIESSSPSASLDVGGASVAHRGSRTSIVTVSGPSNGADTNRYEIARLGVNQVHWGNNGVIKIQLSQTYYGAGAIQNWYVKAGYTDFSGSAVLVEKFGDYQYARVTLGTPVLTGTSSGGFPNQYIPVYIDVSHYTDWRAKIEHNWSTTSSAVPDRGALKFFDSPSATLLAGTVAQAPDVELSVEGDLLLTGKAGIGTTSPAAKLTIVASPTLDPLQLKDSTGGSFRLGPSVGASGGFQFYDDVAATTRIRIDSSGNVGIGTTAPAEKLQVSGTVRATSFISDTTTYADFVFDDDYELAPLSEVEAHIDAHGHLPDIPSEPEAMANGIDLAAMQVKLLQKVEELTLHVIRQEKVQEELRDQVSSHATENRLLRDRVESLTHQLNQ